MKAVDLIILYFESDNSWSVEVVNPYDNAECYKEINDLSYHQLNHIIENNLSETYEINKINKRVIPKDMIIR